jgi:hypothetical protein
VLDVRREQGLLQQSTAPLSAPFVIQRVGEFCMLILGEIVLSFMALDVEPDYEIYLMFGASAMIACNIYFHHFSTYPADPSKHVLRVGTLNNDSLSYIVVLVTS